MKKVFKIEDLDCAHCAAKIENAVRKIDGVVSADINFLMRKFTLEAEDAEFSAALEKALKICKKIAPDCEVLIK